MPKRVAVEKAFGGGPPGVADEVRDLGIERSGADR